ncbi:MAG: zf-HC2 domain-containing protein [Acidobacteriota bacterium]|nr:zf-HC2 domain-containing protein [Acidobacteriota bacterium]
MNCQNCQNLISEYVDGELSDSESRSFRIHLSICSECAKLAGDFAEIVGFCEENFAEDSTPPNSQALWCRINNIIEAEIEESEVVDEVPVEKAGRGFFGGPLSLSVGQVLASVVLIAVVSSLLTIVGFKNFSAPDDGLAGFEAEPSVFEKVLAKLGVGETPADRAERRLKERKSAIEYWSQRVAKRRVEWDTGTRVTFDRNMDVIDRAVKQYTILLQENPQDEISTEMLDSALNEKMELLREFSEL